MLPLVICSGPRALPTAAVASAYYTAAGIFPIILRPAACAAMDHLFPSDSRFIDDEALAGVGEVRAFLEANKGTLAKFGRSPGWFLQQYLKLAAVAALDEEFVFVADGDTIFSHALLHDILRFPKLLATGENYENYDRLLLALGVTPPQRSCVANGNFFSSDPLLRYLGTPAGFQAVLQQHVLPSVGELDFSEYQITGGLLEHRLSSQHVRMFRRFDLLVEDIEKPPVAFIERALRRYDAVAIEGFHQSSTAKRVGARILYGLGRSW